MKIELINEIEFEGTEMVERMQEVIAGAVAHVTPAELEGEELEVCLTLTDDEGIHALNREHRGVDAVTDVLSFPLLEFSDVEDHDEAESEEDACDFEDIDPLEDYRDPLSGNIMLGDIVVNLDRAAEQAESYGHSFEREACYLCVHSVLHLFGYDHMLDDEKAQMRALEEEIMNGFGIKR